MDQHPNDILSQYIHEPFMMMFAGFFLYFLIVWKRGRNAGKWNSKKPSFWQDQKDDMAVAFFAGMMFVIWDSQVLAALDFILKYLGVRPEDADPLIVHTYYYFLVSPAVELIARGIDKFTSKKDGS